MAEYLSPSIGQIIPQLDEDCIDLTRQTLVYALTDYTKQLCEYDPELADILLDGKKTLARCVRYVTEQAQKIVAKQAESLTAKEVNELNQAQVHNQQIPMMGIAISDAKIYEWAKAYYYGGDKVEPSDTIPNASAKRTPEKKKDKDKDKKESGSASGDTKDSSKKGKEYSGQQSPTAQMSLFGDAA